MKGRFALAVFAVMLAGAALAQSPELIKQAASTNGGVVILRNALFDNLNDAMINGFAQAYGKQGLSLKVERVQSGAQLNMYEQELRANRVGADILALVDPGT